MPETLDEKPKVGRPSKADRLRDVHALALRRFHAIENASRDDRTMSRNDRRFGTVPGAMWEDPVLSMTFAKKPRFELSYIMGARIRLDGEYRANRPTVTFAPRDVGNSDADETAEALNGLFRSDWADFHGDGMGDNAFSEMALGGMGGGHTPTVWEDDEEDCGKQRVAFKPIVDADLSIYYDLDSKDEQKRDATHAFRVYTKTRAAFEEEWPNEDTSTWPVSTCDGSIYDWHTPDVVKIADYYVVERVKVQTSTVKTLLGKTSTMTGDELDEEPKDYEGDEVEGVDAPRLTPRKRLIAEGCTITPGKKKTIKQVRKYLLSGGGVLEDYGIINGTEIPLPTLYGIRDWVDNKERWQGIVRVASDAQRVLNMVFSRLVELSATGVSKVPVFHPEEIVGVGAQWEGRHLETPAYLQRRRLKDSAGNDMPSPAIEYTPTPEIDQATAGVMQLAQNSLKEILGHKEQHEAIRGNVTGKAIELQQVAKDVMSLIYLDKAKQFMQRVGECWLSAAVDVYVEPGRRLKTIGADMKTRGSITLGEPGVDDKGNIIKRYDLSKAKFDVIVDVGPSTATKRAAIVSALTQLLQILPQDEPETRKVVTAAILANMEGEGLAQVRGYFRKQLVRMGVEKPTELEQAEMDREREAAGQAKPSAQDQALAALAQKEAALARKAEVDAGLSAANTEKARAQTALVEAQTIETVADLDVRTRGGQAPPTR